MSVRSAEELQRKIRLILSQVQRRWSAYKSHDVSERVLSEFSTRGNHYPFDPPPPGSAEIVHEQVSLLRLLYVETTPTLRDRFRQILLSELNENNAAAIVHAVLDTASVDELTKFLRRLKNKFEL